MKLRLFSVAALILFATSAAFAWPSCSGNWVQVPAGTKQGTVGSGNVGAIVTENGQTFECESPSNPSGGGNTNTNNNSASSTSSSSSNSGATSGSSSGASATGGNSSATGGNSSSTANGGAGGSVSGSGNSSSSSGVNNSGNSSNTNNNTAQGGKGGQGGQGGTGVGVGVGIGGGASNNGNGNGNGNGSNNTTTANGGTSNANGNGSNNTTVAKGGSANGNGSNNTTNSTSSATGNGSNNTTAANSNQSQSSTSSANNSGGNSSNSYSSTSNTTVEAPKIPVNTAYAPTTIPTSPCLKGYSGGGQGANFGFAFGGSKVDENCAALETARAFDSMNERLAACKVKINTKYAKKAGVTLEDCMQVEMVPAPPTAPVVEKHEERQQPIVVVVPTPQAAAPVPAIAPQPPAPAIVWTSVCTFASKTVCTAEDKTFTPDPARPTSVCKIMIDSAVRAYKQSPNSRFVLVGNRNREESDLLPTARANNVRKQLEAAGVPASAINVQVGSGTTRTVEIVLIQAQ